MKPRITMVTTGCEELDANLRSLANNAAGRVSRLALAAGGRELARYQRAAAPVGATGMVRKSIGSRVVNIARSGGLITAKAGINVGKRPVAGGSQKNISSFSRAHFKYAPHGHLVVLGTKPRVRQKIGGKFRYLEPSRYHPQPPRSRSTGTMPANPFIRTASMSARGPVQFTIRQAVQKGIAAEVTKIGKKTGRSVAGVT